jgi:pimeloyl-ACP methyl ester carboxylesterase
LNFSIDNRQAFAYTAAHAFDAGKPTLAFLHGAGLDHSTFGLQSRYFGYHGYNVLALDFPGHGRSEGPPVSTIAAMADWALKAVKGRLSIVGHSMGALVALQCANRAPDRVERVACIGVAYPMKVSEAFLDAARRNDHAAYDMETIWGHAAQAPLSGNPHPGMWMYGDMLARLRRLARGVLYNDLKACNDYRSGTDSAAKVRCPVLFLVGRRDVMTPPRAAKQLQERISAARTVERETSGHALMDEAPDATLDALMDFLS